MTVHSAYCVPCDTKVEVSLEEGRTEISARDVRCPAHGDACPAGSCFLGRVSPAQLADQLDYLPSDAEGSGAVRGLAESARLVETARRRSLTREAGRVLRWWSRAGPR